MSLILDALNRADQERTEDNSAPNLHSHHGPMPTPEKPIRRWSLEALVIIIALGILAYSQWPKSTDTVNPELTLSVPVNTTAPALKKEKIESPKQAAEIAENVRPPILSAKESTPTEQTAEIVADNKPAKTSEKVTSLYEKKELDVKPVSVKTDTETPASEPEPKPTAPLQEADQSQNILQEIPLLTARSIRFQRSIPNIDYSIHVYSDNESSGFVKMNGSIRKIGSEVAPGLRVIAILKDSTVMDYNGIQFRLGALNSWVNYN